VVALKKKKKKKKKKKNYSNYIGILVKKIVLLFTI